MKEKTKIFFIAIIIGILIIPIIINYVLMIPTPFNFEIIGDGVNWLSFWGTYLGGIIGASVSFFILYLTLLHNKKEAEIERANRRLLQLQEDLIERISDVNYMPLYINTSNNINVASEISRLEMLFGIYLQKSCTAKFIYGNDGNEFAKQFYEKYDEFITAFKFQIIEMKTILMNGKKDDNMKRLIDEQVEKIPMAYYIYSKSVNEVALKYYESEKEKLKLLKRGIL